ncbi:hypothetical protein [Shouchella lonarensis]|uniref:Uncharacterized protein n=1 Tax=Shouchella lonarensis TaxID=1464122 RepID=A0A1G6IJW5_9BACI|nr:hypothetical protein [Shouchella lonarensis]SDC06819.1 hypothetical protein SAMN05421737_10590 [Shouchella lonarensis]
MDVEQEVKDLLRRIENRTKFTTIYMWFTEICHTKEGREKRIDIWVEYIRMACWQSIYFLLLISFWFKFSGIIFSYIDGMKSAIGLVILFFVIPVVIPIAILIKRSDTLVCSAYNITGEKLKSKLDCFKKKLAEEEINNWLNNPKVNECIVRKHALPIVERKIEREIKRKEEKSVSAFLSSMIPPAVIAFSVAFVTFIFDMGKVQMLNDPEEKEKLNDPTFVDVIVSSFMIYFYIIFGMMVFLGGVIHFLLLPMRQNGPKMRRLILLKKILSMYLAKKDMNRII